MARAEPKTVEDLIEVFKRVTPPEYHQPIIDDPRGSFALVRATAKMFAELSEKIHRSAQATFFLQHANQVGQPASSAVRSAFSVDLRRTADLDQGRIIGAGELLLDGPQGRQYENVDLVEWIPFDTELTKTVRMQAVAPGYIFNLDHLADSHGLITAGVHDPEAAANLNGPDAATISIRRQSADRTSINASIDAATSTSQRARLVDSGRPNRLLASDVGLYVRIENASNAFNIGRVLRVTGFEAPGLEVPPGSGIVPRQAVLDDGPQRFRLFSAQADDGGVLTDQTVLANQEAVDDMTLLPAAPAVGDAYYFGASDPMSSLWVDVSTPADWVGALTWEYWDGASWSVFPALEDDTIGFTASGLNEVRWTVPAGWAVTTVNGRGAFYTRARVSAFTSLADQPLGRQAYSMIQNQLVGESGTVTWAALDWVDLGFELARVEAPTGGRDDDLRLLGKERGAAQQESETDDQFRDRVARLAEVVSPSAIRAVVNRQLEPYGLAGQAFDVSPDSEPEHFVGMFLDIDALDYYEPGDTFPESPFVLPLSLEEAHGHFWIRVPYIGNGDFGAALDDGPVFYVDPPGSYVGPAMTDGFMDGYPFDGNAVYAAIWDAVKRIAGGGVGFTIFRDAATNADPCP